MLRLLQREFLPLLLGAIGLVGLSLILPADVWYHQLVVIGVIVIGALLIIATDHKAVYPTYILWLLWAWGLLHIIGGAAIGSNGQVFYQQMIIPILGEPYLVLKYDQIVHTFGFGVGTVLAYHFLQPSLSPAARGKRLWFIIVMAGLGIGAVNEIVEFFLTVFLPNTDVGGYVNTCIDLIADTIGAMVVASVIVWKRR